MRRSTVSRVAVMGLALAIGPSAARASNKYLEVPPLELVKTSPAYRYANLSDEEAILELELRNIPYRHATPAVPGVRLPIRLMGPLHGVTVRSTLPEEKRADSPFEILDARLALALDDFCHILVKHEIVELVHFTIYRPPAVAPADGNAPRTRHPGGVAIDVGALKKASGHWLTVGPHWSSAIGAKTCGDGARKLDKPEGKELQSILCEAYDQRIFTYMLTPHFDKAHADHLHLEIKPVVKWFLVN
jgi:hypothetical protein